MSERFQVPASRRRWVLAERPEGPIVDTTFRLEEEPVPTLSEGEVLVRTLWLGFDPAQRGTLNDVPSYVPPVALGATMRGSGLGEVVASESRDFRVGSVVVGQLGWQDLAVIDPAAEDANLAIVPPGVDPPSLLLGVAGTTGITAYIGMKEYAHVQPGDSVLVTAAAGATGSIAGQIARLLGASRVVGTAGSPEKRAWVTDVAGFDDCVDHYDPKVFRRLREVQPDGFDVVFDNVGGDLLDVTLANLALNARLVMCGSISTGYRPERPAGGLRNYQFLTTRRASLRGFIVLDHREEFATVRGQLVDWVRSGELSYAEDVVEGFENAPAALQRLFDGRNTGKQLVRVAAPFA